MTSRRRFLSATAAIATLSPVTGRAAKTSPAGFPYTEFEALIRRRDFRDMTKDVLPTPCMIVDQTIFEHKREDYGGTDQGAWHQRSTARQDSQKRGYRQGPDGARSDRTDL